MTESIFVRRSVIKVLFLDLETTGLDPNSCVILEIGAKVVDEKFNIVDQFKRVVQHDPLPQMDDWCRKTHAESGLLTEIAVDGIPLKFAELGLCAFVDKHFPEGKVILAGNSIHFDRSFIKVNMQEFERRLHYRMLDVTSVWLARNIFTNGPVIKHDSSHRALADIDNSIGFLKQLLSQVQA